MLNTILVVLLSFNMFVSNGPGYLLTGVSPKVRERNTGTLEKMIAASGNVAIDLDLNRLNGTGFGTKGSLPGALRFDVERDSFLRSLLLTVSCAGHCPARWD